MFSEAEILAKATKLARERLAAKSEQTPEQDSGVSASDKEPLTAAAPKAEESAAAATPVAGDVYQAAEPGAGVVYRAAEPGEVRVGKEQKPDAGFVPTSEWQEVPEGVAIPPGLEIKMDLESGKNQARIYAAKNENDAPQTPEPNVSPARDKEPEIVSAPSEGKRKTLKIKRDGKEVELHPVDSPEEETVEKGDESEKKYEEDWKKDFWLEYLDDTAETPEERSEGPDRQPELSEEEKARRKKVLKTRLDNAKSYYEELKNRIEAGEQVGERNLFERDEKSRRQLEEAEADYNAAKLEYLSFDINNYFELQNELLEERFLKQQEEMENRNWLRKGAEKGFDWYNKLGKGKKLAISFGLLGVGLAAGAGTAVAGGALVGRRVLATVGTSSGLYGLMKGRMEAQDRKKLEKLLKDENAHPADVVEQALVVKAHMMLNGKTLDTLSKEDVLKKADKVLLDHMQSSMESEAQSVVVQKLETLLGLVDEDLDEKFKSIKSKQRWRMGAAALGGVFVGGGGFAKVISSTLEHAFPVHELSDESQKLVEEKIQSLNESNLDQAKTMKEGATWLTPVADEPSEFEGPPAPSDLSPQATPAEIPGGGENNMIADQSEVDGKLAGSTETPVEHQAVAIEHDEVDTGASVEVNGDGSLIVHAGQRGIEGSLLDLKEARPEEYGKFTSWLKQNYSSETPGADNSDGALVHRFVSDYQDQSGDINWIEKGQVTISPEGHPQISEVVYMDQVDIPAGTPVAETLPTETAEPSVEIPEEQTSEPESVITGEEISNDDIRAPEPQDGNPSEGGGGSSAQDDLEVRSRRPVSAEDRPWPPASEDYSSNSPSVDDEIIAPQPELPEIINRVAEATSLETAQAYFEVLELSPEDVNRISNMILYDFLDNYDHSTDSGYQAKYGKLYNTMKQFLQSKSESGVWSSPQDARSINMFAAILEDAMDFHNHLT